MRISHRIVLALVLLVPAVSHAQSKCPWINEATAHGILGGAGNMNANVSDQGFGVCTFSRHQGSAVQELRIKVDLLTDVARQFPTYLEQCPAKSISLRAIGNEAVMCSVQAKDNQYEEIVVGRVRNQAFVVSVSSSVQADPAMTQEMRSEKAKLLAEHVAGMLY